MPLASQSDGSPYEVRTASTTTESCKRGFTAQCHRCLNNCNKLILFTIIVLISHLSLAQCTKTIETNSDVVRRIRRDTNSEKRVVCYYTNWSVYRPGTAKFSPQNINPYLCTHLIYAFGGLDRENGLRPFDKYQDIEQGGYAKFTGLKTYNKNLKTMLAIGGWNEGSARFSPLVADEERRKEFVINVIKFLRQNHFDGLDLDWEYPAFRDGGKSRDRDNYAQLVQELREEFDRESSKTGRTRLLLTMAVPAGIEYIDKGYDIPKLNRYLDFMNILSYDYHSAFEPAVNHHSPLFSLEEDHEYNFDAQLSIDYTVKHYLKSGADRDKLVLGIPTYGRSYTLFNPESNQLGAPADGPGEQGDATREKGYLAYYEICSSIKGDKDWKIEHPKRSAMGPYAFKGNQWVGYDDIDIVKEKSKYVNTNDLGGIMFWSIDNDDFRGTCHDRPYPLIEAGKEAMLGSPNESKNKLNNNVRPTSEARTSRPSTTVSTLQRRPKPNKLKPPQRGSHTTQRATTSTTTTTAGSLTTPEPPTTPDPGSDFVCKDEGFFPHPRDCKKYFWCLDSGPSNLGIVAHQFTCPSGLFFNKAADSCDFARNVLCKEKKEPKTTTTTATSTTAASTTSSSRSKFTAATAKSTGIRYTIPTTTTTTTTTTIAPPPEEEVVEEDDYDHAEEDPQSIKQLITLIKKLGGIAELEKQLEGNGGTESGIEITPPSSISRNLYNRVLTPGKYQSPYRNGPSGPQNEGLSQTIGDDEDSSQRRGKPQYVTISRERPSTKSPPVEESPSVEGQSRLTYSTLNRNKAVVDNTEDEGIEHEQVKSVSPRYKTIERRKPEQRHNQEEDQVEESEVSVRPKYTSIQRVRPTTASTSSVADTYQTTTSRYVTLHRRPVEDSESQAQEDTSSSSSLSPYYRKSDDKYGDISNHRLKTNSPDTEDGDDEVSRSSDEETRTSSVKPLKKVSGENEHIEPIGTADDVISAGLKSNLTTIVTTPIPQITTNNNEHTDDVNKRFYVYASENLITTTKKPTVTKTDLDRLFSRTSSELVTSTPLSTIPYQTSTITSVVTMVVEGATERQKVPLSQLEKVLADHDIKDHLLPQIPSPFNPEINNDAVINNNVVSSSPNSIVSSYPYNRNNRRNKQPLNIRNNFNSNSDNLDTTTKHVPNYILNNRRRKNKNLLDNKTTNSVEKTDNETSRHFTPSTQFRGRIRSTTERNKKPDDDRTENTNPETLSRFDRRRNRTSTFNRQFNRTSTTLSDVDVTNSVTPRSRFILNRNNRLTTPIDESQSTTTRSRIRFRGRTPHDVTTDNILKTTEETHTNKNIFRRNKYKNPVNIANNSDEPVRPKDDSSELLISMENINAILKNNNTNTQNDSTISNTIKPEVQQDLINNDILLGSNVTDAELPTVVNSTNKITSLLDQLQSSQEEITNVATEVANVTDNYDYINRVPDYKNSTNSSNTKRRKSKLIKVRLCNNSNNVRPDSNRNRLGIDENGNECLLQNATDTKDNKRIVFINKHNDNINDNLNNNNNGTRSRGRAKFNDNPVQEDVTTVKTFEPQSEEKLFRRNNQNRSNNALENVNNRNTNDEILQQEHSRKRHRLVVSNSKEDLIRDRPVTDENVRVVKRRKLVQNENVDNRRVTESNGRNGRNRNSFRYNDDSVTANQSNSQVTTERNLNRRRGNKKFVDTEESVDYGKLSNNSTSSSEQNRTAPSIRRRVPVRSRNEKLNEDVTNIASNERNINPRRTNGADTRRRRVNEREINNNNDKSSELRSSKNSRRVVSYDDNNNNPVRGRNINTYNADYKLYSSTDDLEISHSQYESTNVKKSNDLEKVYRGSKRVKDLVIGADYVEEINRDDYVNKDDAYYDDDDSNGDYSDFLKAETVQGAAIHSKSNSVIGVLSRPQGIADNEFTETEVNRSRVSVRRPVSRNKSNTASLGNGDESSANSVATTARSQGKFLRRRVNKYRTDGPSRSDAISENNFTAIVTTIKPQPFERVTIAPDIGAITTHRGKKFEFPKRTARPSTSLQQPLASPIQRTTSDLSDETPSTGVDSQIVESKEEPAMTEDSAAATLPDLANVAVAAIQSLATAAPQPPSAAFFETTTTYKPISTSRRKLSKSTPVISILSTTVPNTIKVTPTAFSRGTPRPFSKKRINQSERVTTETPPIRVSTSKQSFVSKTKIPIQTSYDYDSDYYGVDPVDIPLSGKVRIHNDGYIECLDIGNFPHPFSCKKFISCAKMENDHLLGWEYTCPRGLSFDPVGGICNWSAGLGCKE